MRKREVLKEMKRQRSLFERSKAAYEAIPDKNAQVARLHFNRMTKAEESIKRLKAL